MENRKELNPDEMEQVSGGGRIKFYTTRFYRINTPEYTSIVIDNRCPLCGRYLFNNQCDACYFIWMESAENA